MDLYVLKTAEGEKQTARGLDEAQSALLRYLSANPEDPEFRNLRFSGPQGPHETLVKPPTWLERAEVGQWTEDDHSRWDELAKKFVANLVYVRPNDEGAQPLVVAWNAADDLKVIDCVVESSGEKRYLAALGVLADVVGVARLHPER